MSDKFIITGLVRELESGVGLGGLTVRAYDKDLIYDDLMGEARTACDGTFRIVSDAKDFRDFFEKRPRHPSALLHALHRGHGSGALGGSVHSNQLKPTRWKGNNDENQTPK
jgi:hypothetical protein